MSMSLLERGEQDLSCGPDELEDFFENGVIGLHLVDGEGVIRRANRAELALLGYSRDEYVGRPIADFHADADVLAEILRRLAAGEKLDRYPARLKAKDGSIKHVEISSSARLVDGELVNTRCFTVDVSHAREAEAARLQAERRLINSYESVTVGIGETDPSGRFTRVNAAFERLTGYSRDELLEMSFEQLTHPEDRPEDVMLYREQVAGQRPAYNVEKRYVRKDGGIVYVEVLSSTAAGPDGRFEYGVRVVKDITDRVLAEQRLEESERRSQDLLDALPMAVYTTDKDGKITYYNEAAVAFAGRRPRLGVDEWCVTWKLYWTDGRPLPHDECPMALALKTGEELRGVDAVAERPDGSRLVFTPFPTVLRDGNGEVVGAINVLVDITERKRADEAQKVLIDELNHRVKNTLATVQSMALQTQRASPEAFVERFEGRLLALSRSHDLLTRRRWTGVSLGELLDQSLGPYADDPQRQIAFDGPELTLSARAGLAFGMVLHELASNAARHGALSVASGSLDIRWSIKETDDRRILSLHWSEHDGPTVTMAPPRSFGLRLVERNITKDLGGSLSLRFQTAGLEVSLSFPIA